MKKIIILLAFAFSLPFMSKAQDMADALRYSQFQVQGTARSGGMGNAFGALGGDFTSVSINRLALDYTVPLNLFLHQYSVRYRWKPIIEITC